MDKENPLISQGPPPPGPAPALGAKTPSARALFLISQVPPPDLSHPKVFTVDATRCPIYHWDIRDAEAAARICSAFYQETVTVQATGTGHWVLEFGPKARAERSAGTCEVCHAYPCACDCPDSCRR